MKTALLKLPTFFLLITAVLLSNTFAQTGSGNWEKVEKLPVNTGLFIETTNKKTVTGYLISANEESLKYTDKKGGKELKKEEIKKIFYGFETERISKWKRVFAGIGTFFGVLLLSGSVVNSIDFKDLKNEDFATLVIPPVVATAATIATVTGLKQYKKLTKGALIYEKN